jgi:hypothetical protein
MPDRKKKPKKKRKSFIDQVRGLLREDTEGDATGTGGATRRNRLDRAVDDAVRGASEDRRR